MSGRHRKPTTSSVSVAKIAVTGAVLSGTSLGLAGAAQAASDSEWDTVAACESSGNWAINTGNGYQGGLQFSPSTWLGYGGGQFASAAHYATRDQQIAIAEKVLAGQGKGAWPVCGRGLSGPTPRDVSTTSVNAHTKAPAAPAETPADAPAPAATEGAPAPEVLPAPAPQDAVPAAEGAPVPAPEGAPAPAPEGAPVPAPEGAPAPAPDVLPAPAPQDAAPAPEGAPAPAPEGAPAPAPQDGAPIAPEAPQLEIIAISETTVTPDQVVTIDAVASSPDGTIVQAGLITPAPETPADPAVPPVVPVVPTTVLPVPADPAAPAPAAVVAPVPAAVAAPAPGDPTAPGDPSAPAPAAPQVVAAGQLQDGVPHLPSPQAPPPGTSTDPGQAGNPNVSYLKELWHAVQDQQIDKNELLLALAQRSFTGPIPAGDAAPAPAPAG